MSEPDSDDPDIYSMTKVQLLEYAREKGIEGVSSSMLKAEILSAIEKAEVWL